jgi:hypothetical protein
VLRTEISKNIATAGAGGTGAAGTASSGAANGAVGGAGGRALGAAIAGNPIAITDSLLYLNTTHGGAGGAGGAGANGVNNTGSAGGAGGPSGVSIGGTIFSESGAVDLTNTTLTENVAAAGSGGTGGTGGPHGNGGAGGGSDAGSGGAVAVTFGGHLRLDSVTMAGNAAGASAPTPGGSAGTGNGGTAGAAGSSSIGLGNDIDIGGSTSTTLELRDSIIAGGAVQASASGNCYEADEIPSEKTTVTSDGHNIDDGNSCIQVVAAGDQVNAPAGLGPLAANGGPTLTMALLAGSPAIGGGASPCLDLTGAPLTTDQRGVARGTPCDVGAFEGQPAPAPGGGGDTGTGPPPPPPPGEPSSDAQGNAGVAQQGTPPPERLTHLSLLYHGHHPSPTIKRGTQGHVTFDMTPAERVTFKLETDRPGVKVNGVCVLSVRTRHHSSHLRPCTFHDVVPGPKAVNATNGANSVAWTPSHTLEPGRYALSARPHNGTSEQIFFNVTS